jgi:hypothetical protein
VLHGWGGHAYGSFKATGETTYSWLLDLAKEQELSGLRIWLYGYRAGLQDESLNDADTWAENFLSTLRALRYYTGVCIAHPSMLCSPSSSSTVTKAGDLHSTQSWWTRAEAGMFSQRQAISAR